MARKKTSQNAPYGWVIDPIEERVDLSDGKVKSMAAHASPSLDALRKKFLIVPTTDAAPAAVHYAKSADDFEVIRVRPKGGGDAKIAFRGPDGKIEIMQG
jgi:hypothetical protein